MNYASFKAWLTEAKKEKEEVEDESDESSKSDKKSKITFHKGEEEVKEEFELEEDLDESILGDKNDGAYKAGHQPKGRVVKGKSYGADYEDEEGSEKKPAPAGEKRGRGRPKKGSDETGEVKKYTFNDLLNKISARK